ncbi:MAG TPA: glutamate racemase, partial [Beijerinckiaceae bacterium]|nr:glutamate racemase [Beijerinckiaceae bacterium]
GLGGLTVYTEILEARPNADFIYAADDAAFPYGRLDEVALLARVAEVMKELIAAYRPDIVVIACNTASTLVLPELRATFPTLPFVGTVPAVKPAATRSKSRLISVLATPGTVARDYTRDLIRQYAAHCDVALVGSQDLAALAETHMQGEAVADEDVWREIAPCFVRSGERHTDHIVLACTHYPLLGEAFERLAPWPVEWVDPAPAIAQRTCHVLAEQGFAPPTESHSASGVAIFSSARPPTPALADALRQRRLAPRLWPSVRD